MATFIMTPAEAKQYADPHCRICNGEGCKVTGSAVINFKTITGFMACPNPRCVREKLVKEWQISPADQVRVVSEAVK